MGQARATALDRTRWWLDWQVRRLPDRAVAAGLPPAWLGWRRVRQETLARYRQRHAGDGLAGRLEVVHPARAFANPLPRNIARREDLSDEAGWWGFSCRDVPERRGDATVVATLPDCRIVFARDTHRGEFHPAILNRDGRALRLREMTPKPFHAPMLRGTAEPVRLERATWVLERVYDNHSHWLTAHLPKLVLLRDRGALADVILPVRPTPTMAASLAMLGMDPAAFPTFDETRPLLVGELTILATDRFRPALLRPVRDALAPRQENPPRRRVFISRAGAKGRHLVNEEALWPLLRAAGFVRVRMEELGFPEQVRLMTETAVLLAPHGAGLTNMLFCPAGAQVVEIGDPGFPNPNFYALACAMGLDYWAVPAEALGDGHPLTRDLRVDPAALAAVLDRLPG